MQLSLTKRIAFNLVATAFLPVFFLAALLPARRRLLVWGSTPIIGNKYWSAAVREMGLESVTVMGGTYAIQQNTDFDRYFPDFAPRFLPRPVRFAVGSCIALAWLLRRGRVLHTSFWGFALGHTAYWRLEGLLCRIAGVRTIVIPFGMDASISSQLIDTSVKYAVLAAYPQMARNEGAVVPRVRYWTRHADVVVTGYVVDGIGRWDVTTHHVYVIDTRTWSPKADHSDHDGRNGPVKVLHNPNHRGSKGTEFVIEAVRRLQEEGLQVELVLAEKVSNDRIKQMMQEADIHADQFIYSAYGISAMEAMSSGLPVLSNLSEEAYTRVFRRYGFLDECPILSTTPETLVENLRILVTRPELRRLLGAAGRQFAEKYHSYRTAQYLFGSIYDRILDGKEVDLINLFHPLTSPYNNGSPKIAHPLEENRLPDDHPFA